VSWIPNLREGFRAKASWFPPRANWSEILARGSAGVLAVAPGRARRDEILVVDLVGLFWGGVLAGRASFDCKLWSSTCSGCNRC
jgi:hypothetical protein